MATSSPHRKSAMGKKAEERAKPMSNPDRSSGFTICLSPADRKPRITTVSVWVPTASAM